MADDASRLFYLSDTSYLAYISFVPQPLGLWHIPPADRTAFLRDLHAVQEAMQSGTTKDARQKSLYHQWTDIFSTLLVNPDLQDPFIPRIKLLQVYGHRVQHAQHSKHQVGRLGK